uniref:Amidase domain-containing protein n=1 Tax=Emiliania huxleyi TaxID=2903 RepID=A0A7S3WER0_EMIHU
MCEDPKYSIECVKFHPDFPPKEIIDQDYERGQGFAKVPDLYPEIGAWFTDVFATKPCPPMEPTAREKMLYQMTAADYVAMFKAGEVTAKEYAEALVNRMMHYEMLNAWFVTSYETSHYIIEDAQAIDDKAAADGVESVAPLYGLPVPAKGTMASTDYPGGAGLGILDGCYSTDDAALLKLIKEANGIIMGKTNVPEYACSWQTMNHMNGVTRNGYDFELAVCGSSGGSASAVGSYIAPLAITEDTGGSTRCPAHANGNFGYDPPRNKYPNDGNPGITHFRDQLGTNARSMDDILLFDMAVLGLQDEHANAEANVAAMTNDAIKIGFPTEIFVNLNVPASVRALDGGLSYSGPDRRASASLRNALSQAKMIVSGAGFSMTEEEWPEVESPTLGKVNALYHMLSGFEFEPGTPWTYSVCAQTFTGQIAQWQHNYFLANTTTIADVIDDTRPVGVSHGPAGCFRGYNGNTGESKLRYCGVYQTLAPEFWNMYFEQTGVDMIITPTQFTPIQKNSENAMGTIPIEVKNMTDGTYDTVEMGSTGTTGSVHYSYFKMIHISKVVVPIGVDENGAPMSFTIWGKAMPKEETFCDKCAETFDLEFLYKVKKVVAALHGPDSPLKRVPSPLAMADGLM